MDRRALFAKAMRPGQVGGEVQVDVAFQRQCEDRLRSLREMEPLSGLDIHSLLAQHRMSRRAFVGWTAGITAALMPDLLSS